MDGDRTSGAGRRSAGGRASPRRSGACATSPPSASPTTRCSCASCRCTTPSCPAGDVDDRKLDDVYAVAVAHLALGRVRAPGRDRRPGAVARPRPRRLAVAALGAARRHRRHAVPRRHDADGPRAPRPRRPPARPPDARPSRDDARPARRRRARHRRRRRRPLEAWTQIEIDRTDDATARRARGRDPRAPSTTSAASSRTSPAMRDRMAALGDVDPILPWLAAGQFVFLGAADYDVGADGALTLRAGQRARPRPATTTACATRRRCPATAPVAIARTDDTSTVFRADRQTVVAVTARTADARRRFVGLLATNAYRVSVLDIPGVGAGASPTPSTSAEARMHSHTGRATRTVLENLPRDLVLELEPTALAQLVGDDRRAAGAPAGPRLRGARAGRPVGHRARLPAAQPLHRRAARARRRRRRRRLRRRSADVRVARRRQLAGPHHGQRAPPRRPAVGRPRDARAARSTSCRRRGPTGCGRRSSPSSARSAAARLFDRVGAHAPPAYRAAVPPERAIGDVRRIAALLAGDDELTTSLGHDVDAPPGEWRFRVYRQGAPAALSELLPLLDHLGLQALDERPYTFRLGDERVLRLRHRRPRRRPASSSTSAAAPRCRTRSPRSSPARSRATGSTASSCRAGLERPRGRDACGPTASTCARSASPSARRTSRTRSAAIPRLVADLVALFHARFDPARVGGAAERAAATRSPAPSRGSSTRRSTPSRASTTTASAGRS